MKRAADTAFFKMMAPHRRAAAEPDVETAEWLSRPVPRLGAEAGQQIKHHPRGPAGFTLTGPAFRLPDWLFYVIDLSQNCY
ncbi:hypothetical protein [Acidocella facilis]|uniref:hypothetical protein n=1 Tax=Acidocella facilis TaxID=525 RepID=UPI001F402B19|nr:hypothetical protein [Acidocella facilis]